MSSGHSGTTGKNRTNLLWMSEGLTVYYEYMLVRRAGLASLQDFFTDFESNINAVENDPGRLYQSLTEASYNTWSEGPFGRQGKEGDRSISYYDKGPAVGLILDLAIRHHSENTKSLDDVMPYLYYHYYKNLDRGFTDAEFQRACELMAGNSMSEEFEFVNTTKEIDYNLYLSYAGLKLTEVQSQDSGLRKFAIQKVDNISRDQEAILRSWSGQ